MRRDAHRIERLLVMSVGSPEEMRALR
jgi:hypothetical protein